MTTKRWGHEHDSESATQLKPLISKYLLKAHSY